MDMNGRQPLKVEAAEPDALYAVPNDIPLSQNML